MFVSVVCKFDLEKKSLLNCFEVVFLFICILLFLANSISVSRITELMWHSPLKFLTQKDTNTFYCHVTFATKKSLYSEKKNDHYIQVERARFCFLFWPFCVSKTIQKLKILPKFISYCHFCSFPQFDGHSGPG